jgi:hypothetical protein
MWGSGRLLHLRAALRPIGAGHPEGTALTSWRRPKAKRPADLPLVTGWVEDPAQTPAVLVSSGWISVMLDEGSRAARCTAAGHAAGRRSPRAARLQSKMVSRMSLTAWSSSSMACQILLAPR